MSGKINTSSHAENGGSTMPITTQAMAAWCRGLLGADPSAATLSLEQYLAAVPRLESLADVPRGTPVLVRGDVDAKPGEKVGDGDIRLRSMRETLEFGRQRGWIQIIFGHIGRKPEGSLDKVAKRIGDILGCQVTLVKDWLDPATNTVTDAAAKAVKSAAPGDVIVLENARKYPIEQVLWKAKPADCRQAGPLAGQVGQRNGREDRQGLRQRSLFGGQPRRLDLRHSGDDGPRGVGRLRRRAVRRAR